jgi:uncharacterized protein YraI
MAFKKTLIAAGLAVATALATTAAASAAPAYATSNVNVRSGPGTGYAVVDALRRGDRVDIQYCRGSWCFVEKRGPDGWVSSNYLSSGGGWNDDDWRPTPPRPPVYNPYPPRPPHWGNPYPPRPPHWNPRPLPQPVYPGRPGGSFCYNGPNGYFCVGN